MSIDPRRGVRVKCRPLEIDQDSMRALPDARATAEGSGVPPAQPDWSDSTGSTAWEHEMADLLTLKKFEALSPFEIKDELINLAKATSKRTQSAFLNAGRGNPNWVATTPREGFFLLGQFAITECKRVMHHPAGIGGMPAAKGIAARLEEWLPQHPNKPGAQGLKKTGALAGQKV